MSEEKIIEFLIEAKKATYAAGDGELSYEKDDLSYIDSYVGDKQFAGQEIVSENDEPVWAMNYAGRVIGGGFSGDFLKEALSEVSAERPFRGPEEYASGDYLYKCEFNGDFEWFDGYEEIYLGGLMIYECLFHGGSIL